MHYRYTQNCSWNKASSYRSRTTSFPWTMSSHHRSGIWVQKNKNHKHGQHKSKGTLHNQQKGRVVKPGVGKRRKDQAINKIVRKNQKAQKKALRDFKSFQEKQKVDSVPLDILIIPLCEQISPEKFLDLLRTTQNEEDVEMTEKSVNCVRLKFPRFKMDSVFRVANLGDLFGTLDLAKASDVLLFLHDPFEEMSAEIGSVLSSVLGQGLPAAVAHCVFIEVERDQNVQVFLKEKSEVKKSVAKRIEPWFPDASLEFVCGSPDISTFLFRISNMRPQMTEYREMRPFLIATDTVFITENNQSEEGFVEISGILKGGVLDVNHPIHIPGFGNYFLEEVRVQPPGSQSKKERDRKVGTVPPASCIKANPNEQHSESEDVEFDENPSEDLIDPSTVVSQKKRTVKLVPKGTSQYQAAWIVDDNDDNEAGDESEGAEDDAMDVEGGDNLDQECEKMSVGSVPEGADDELVEEQTDKEDGYDGRFDEENEREAYSKAQAQRMDEQFPDELDTPLDVPARVRFFKYRGLDDYRSTQWDVNENLPPDYARICKFSNMRSFKKAALDFSNRTTVEPYNYVTLKLKNAPRKLVDSSSPLTVFGLLMHEAKMTVANLSLNRVVGFDEPLKSNEEFVFQLGFRRFRCTALLSELSPGRLHKFLRFLPNAGHFVASIYAPIIYPPTPVLMYKETSDGALTLLASGSLLSLDPDRVVLKRVVLSGHPFKINVRSAVIRFMFFNKDDINWFKKVRLTTKHGRTGEIKEPLGTHGHMKCRFDGQLQSSDTVLLKLYKRVFPKWTYAPMLTIA
ncbi:pre-rRNA-processing protein TSR1 homolog isoform X2 [Paramacrobiotus metropolitanus]|uniref:pre-rRNA-processing protein TSR1 homolog isoform X2 n=1 Tax=Paramacrobiotus metropolitanus TaxID=2943436 RepID=UPI002445CC1F|nr:pre-rRNA-processing protein TSR1 homolog isoform X2 [Paramacrobiotus metropolitanus]